jgi:adenosylcobinamide-GDP ribazoletransferase
MEIPEFENDKARVMAEIPPRHKPAEGHVLASLRQQWWSAWAFLTRLPAAPHAPVPLGRAAWAIPLVGLVIGGGGAAVMALAETLGIGPLAAAALAIGAMTMATGALHEDGLADTADAFTQRHSAERTHAILKDPRLGAYGGTALCLVLLLRVLLAAEAGPLALLAAETAGRVAIGATMAFATAAGTGQGVAAGAASKRGTIVAIILLAASSLALVGVSAIVGVVAAAFATGCLARITRRRIGGYTGDILGAIEQISVIAMLLSLALGH